MDGLGMNGRTSEVDSIVYETYSRWCSSPFVGMDVGLQPLWAQVRA